MGLIGQMDRIELVVSGTPHGRPRPVPMGAKTRTGKIVGRMVHPRSSKNPKTKAGKAWAKANAWFAAVQAATLGKAPEEPWEGPIRLTIDAYFERPQRLMKKSSPEGPVLHDVKPDRDNVDKAVMDALKQSRMFKDDSQCCQGAVSKWYAAKGCGPGVVIVIERVLADGVQPSKDREDSPQRRREHREERGMVKAKEGV